MTEEKVEITDEGIHATGEDGEEVTIDATGIHVKDKDARVNINLCGIDIEEGKTRVKISSIGCFLGCLGVVIVTVAVITAVVMGVVKLMS